MSARSKATGCCHALGSRSRTRTRTRTRALADAGRTQGKTPASQRAPKRRLEVLEDRRARTPLFDLSRDARKRANLAARKPTRLAELGERWERWAAAVPAILPAAGVALVYGAAQTSRSTH